MNDPRLIEVRVRPNGAPEYRLLDTDAGLKGCCTRYSIKQGVGQLLHKHLERGGKVVVLDRDTGKAVLEVVVNPLTLGCANGGERFRPGPEVDFSNEEKF